MVVSKKIRWCQAKGLKLIEPNSNLSSLYIKYALETLNELRTTNSNMWIATQKYYLEYFLATAILMKLGISSKIHECTFEIIKLLENNNIIDFRFNELLEKDKNLRIENQYYLKNNNIIINYEEIINLISKIKTICNSITLKQMIHIKKQLTLLTKTSHPKSSYKRH